MDERNARIAKAHESKPEEREVTDNQGPSSQISDPDEAISEGLTEVDAKPDVTDTRPTNQPSSFSYGRRSTTHHVSTRYSEEELEKNCRYNMNHAKRGIALIFNHENFKDRLSKRSGAEEDGRTLSYTMKHLGFDVREYKDKESSEIMEILSQVAGENHTEHDCLLVAIMSHGEENGILFASDYAYKVDEVWGRFKADKVPTLAGKPKIFLFQACRGKKLEKSVITFDSTDSSSSRGLILPSSADFLMVYSTVEGHYSWRNTTEGSWLIQDLCKELNKDARSKDMLTILTNTLRRVAYTRFSSTPTTPDMNRRQQMPVFSSTLTRLLYFDETTL
ncbi:hypothetical protein J437_LFUL012223 [Ladona fulva]|uniref:Caspase-3 n=1 Tax=Ladona fulva TaxID=123851 RepID=A0A8K0KFA6_LADFU|nr:hypothetical protein J437_LFUL012223 [Ladona fulva]